MKRDAYEWLFHASDAARQVLKELDAPVCEICGLPTPTVSVGYHIACPDCQAQIDECRDEEPEDHGESFGELYAKRVRGDM